MPDYLSTAEVKTVLSKVTEVLRSSVLPESSEVVAGIQAIINPLLHALYGEGEQPAKRPKPQYAYRAGSLEFKSALRMLGIELVIDSHRGWQPQVELKSGDVGQAVAVAAAAAAPTQAIFPEEDAITKAASMCISFEMLSFTKLT